MVTSNKDSIPCNTFCFQCIYNILEKYKLSKNIESKYCTLQKFEKL